MSISDGHHRYPVSGNRQRLVTIKDSDILDAFTKHSDGKIEEIPASQQREVLEELKAQRGGK